jgi:hypothetical protein
VGTIVLFGIAGSAIVTLTFLPALTVRALTWRSGRWHRFRRGSLSRLSATPGLPD